MHHGRFQVHVAHAVGQALDLHQHLSGISSTQHGKELASRRTQSKVTQGQATVLVRAVADAHCDLGAAAERELQNLAVEFHGASARLVCLLEIPILHTAQHKVGKAL